MKEIGKLNAGSDLEAIRQKNAPESRRPEKSGGTAVGKNTLLAADAIKVSAHAGNIGKLVEAVKELPEVRAAKVAALREKIAAGTYQPSGESIAVAILKEDLP